MENFMNLINRFVSSLERIAATMEVSLAADGIDVPAATEKKTGKAAVTSPTETTAATAGTANTSTTPAATAAAAAAHNKAMADGGYFSLPPALPTAQYNAMTRQEKIAYNKGRRPIILAELTARKIDHNPNADTRKLENLLLSTINTTCAGTTAPPVETTAAAATVGTDAAPKVGYDEAVAALKAVLTNPNKGKDVAKNILKQFGAGKVSDLNNTPERYADFIAACQKEMA